MHRRKELFDYFWNNHALYLSTEQLTSIIKMVDDSRKDASVNLRTNLKILEVNLIADNIAEMSKDFAERLKAVRSLLDEEDV